jgi:hypothetical protein
MATIPRMPDPPNDDILALANRTGLPDALRVLLAEYPRDLWTSHRNFDGLTRFWLERHLGFRQLMDGLQGRTRVFLDRPATRSEAQQVHRMASALIQHLQGTTRSRICTISRSSPPPRRGWSAGSKSSTPITTRWTHSCTRLPRRRMAICAR